MGNGGTRMENGEQEWGTRMENGEQEWEMGNLSGRMKIWSWENKKLELGKWENFSRENGHRNMKSVRRKIG